MKRNMKRLITLLLAGILVISTVACGSKTAETNGSETNAPETNASETGYRIGVLSFSGLGSSTFNASSIALESACAATGNELVKCEMTDYSDESFLAGYESLIDQGIDAAVVCTFSEAVVKLIADLFEEAGVKWFLANRKITDKELREYVFNSDSFVGNCYCDETQIAYDIVEQLNKENGVKNLAVIGLTEGDINGDYRDDGIKTACEDLEVNLLTETRGIATVDDVTNAVEGIIASYPELDGIFIVGGAITTGALAGACQALSNHNLSDSVSIGMIDISTGMSKYMGDGQPLKIAAGGNLIMDNIFAGCGLFNELSGQSLSDDAYFIDTNMMFINNAEDADDYDEYCENLTIPILTADTWNNILIGKTLAEVQKFSDDFSIEYCKELRNEK